MIESLYWVPVGTGTPYELNNYFNPLNLFDPQVEQRVETDRERAEAHGKWPTFSYRGGLEIHCEGAILADDAGDYNDKRIDLVYNLFGAADDPISSRKMGDLVPTFDNQSEAWTTECTITAFSAPLTATSPNFTMYLVTFYSFTPYFLGVDSGDKYYYA